MSLQVNLKLKLVKTKKKITVKYNTFEQATFDEYLMASLALRSKDEKTAREYIDEITGQGSLNAHFSSLYEKIKLLTTEQLIKILDNSMFPILKVDDSNWYNYYPQLRVSEYKNRIYNGDLAEMKNLLEILYITENVIDMNVSELRTFDNAEPYLVSINQGNIKVRIRNDWVDLTSELFNAVFYNELNSEEKYKGTIHSGVDGEGWNILTNAKISDLFSTSNYYYGDDGDHCQIREDGVRKTTVSKINSLYICKEVNLRYSENRKICETVVDFLLQNNSVNSLRTASLINLCHRVDDLRAQAIINAILARGDNKEVAALGLSLMDDGLTRNWASSTMASFLKYANSKQLEPIYIENPNLTYSIEQLLKIKRALLSPAHGNIVDKYYQDLNQMKDTIKKITGEVTTSGLREAVKALQSDNDTKRFSKLCNNLIGHVGKNLEDASMSETEAWLKDARISRSYGKLQILQEVIQVKTAHW